MKKIIITVFLFLILFCGSTSVDAWVPPAGCVADSWIVTRSSTSAYVSFFSGSTYACYLTLGGYGDWWAGDFVFASSGKVDTNEMSTTVSFFAGLLALTAFIAGVNGGKQS